MKGEQKREKVTIKVMTILAVVLLLLSMVSFGIALLKPTQPKTFTLQGKILVSVAESIPPTSSSTGKVIVNVVPKN